jgi:hypothetical protein
LLAEVDGDLAVFSSYSFDAIRARTLRAELAVVNPRHRQRSLSNQLQPLWVLLARALEVEVILGWATLVHPYVQLGCERQGLDLVGILPASERLIVAPGVMKHAFEAVYAASLLPSEQVFWPPLTAMTDRVAALARFVTTPRA